MNIIKMKIRKASMTTATLEKLQSDPKARQPREERGKSTMAPEPHSTWDHVQNLSPPAPGRLIKVESDIRLIAEVPRAPLLILGMTSASHYPIMIESTVR